MALLLSRRRESDRFSAAFVHAIGAPSLPRGSQAPGTLVGLEHEFRVLAAGRPIDFRWLIHQLPIDGRRVDPADPNAYRGSWGGTITCDEREAEIAIPPVLTVPGFTSAVAALAVLGRQRLRAALPLGTTLEGYSTHLSVAVPDRMVERAARLYVETFAPALMLLLDGPASPGLLVRPRPGRLELGGEYVEGDRLRAVVAFVTGSVRAVANAACRPILPRRRLPLAVVVRAEPALERYGWFVAPGSVAPGLYRAGRRAQLRLRRGGTVQAQEYLERCWAVARAALGADGDPADVATMDRIVAGAAPLGVEHEQSSAIAIELPTDEPIEFTPEHPFGALVRVRRRGDLLIEPALVTWDFAVLRVSDGRRTGFACLPRPSLATALAALDAGRLDGALGGFLGAADAGRKLDSARQTAVPGLFGAVAGTAGLLAPEHGPIGEIGDRPGKRRQRDDQDDRNARAEQSNAPSVFNAVRPASASVAGGTILGLSIPVAAALAAIAVVAIVGGTLLVGGGLGGAGASPVGTAASVVPSLESLPPASVAAIASSSPISSPSASPVSEGLAGTFIRTWTVVSAESAPGYPGVILYSQGSTGTTRVEATCDSAACTVWPITASGARTSPGTPDGPATGGPWPLTSVGLLTYTYSSAEPQCGPAATFTATATYVGTDPVQLDGATIFGGFTGSTSIKYQQLHTKGTLPTGKTYECWFINYVVEFTGVRVRP